MLFKDHLNIVASNALANLIFRNLREKSYSCLCYVPTKQFLILFLNQQIDPLERDIKAKKMRILELEVSLETLLKKKAYRGNFQL